MSISEDRRKALETALAGINKQFGDGSARRLGDAPLEKVERISTGSLAVDIALGGGLPKGRIIEIYGPESSGKTLTCLTSIAQVQKSGGVAAFIDAEHAFDPEWAALNGVNVEELVFSQPDSGEDALSIAERLVASGAVDIIVIDSVAALTPQKELDGEIGDSSVGVQARMMSQALRKITASVSKNDTVVIFINQLREKIGVMFGSPETTTGGKALKFYASVRMDIRRREALKDGPETIGARTRIKVVKNKVAPPHKEAEFNIYYDSGISREIDIIRLGVEHGVLKKAGAWVRYSDDTPLANGEEKARLFLKENPDVADDLDQKIRDVIFAVPVVAEEGDAEVANDVA